MNPVIEGHFNAVEIRLLQSPVVITYQLTRREVGPADSYEVLSCPILTCLS